MALYHAAVIDRVPLDSPLWSRVPAYWSTENALDALRTVVRTRQLGQAWESLAEELLVGGELAEFARAAVPHLLDVVPRLSRRDRWRVRTMVGMLVAYGGASLRVWYPSRGATGTVSLDVQPRCLLGTEDTVVVGHDAGLIALTVTDPR